MANLSLQEREVARYFRRGEFNPSSPKQVIEYIRSQGDKPGRNKRTGSDSADKRVLERLSRQTDSPFYRQLRELREIEKIKGPYVSGILERLDEHSRVHGRFTHYPSTMRLSGRDPNLQNFPRRVQVSLGIEGKKVKLADEFRRCVVAQPGCKLVSGDFASIEAVETGWCSGDRDYMRLALLGIHDYVTAHRVGAPTDLRWSDADIAAYHAEIKAKHKALREKIKRVVHETNYWATPKGMYLNDPDTFSNEADARELQNFYYTLCPKLKSWQITMAETAHRQGYLGGRAHPYGYVHWFWNVKSFTKLNRAQAQAVRARGGQIVEIGGSLFSVGWGEDAKRAVAFFPQSISAGVIYETMLELFDPETPYPSSYIGDLYFSKTPLRAQVHDELLLEVPDSKVDQAVTAMRAAMTRPIEEQPCPPEWGMGLHLKLGVSIKVGQNWCEEEMEVVA